MLEWGKATAVRNADDVAWSMRRLDEARLAHLEPH